jgi:DNA adenine methylase
MKSPLNYLGGKSKLAPRIVSMIPADHTCYCEPFSGAAWVFFTKEPSKGEVLNDKDGELANFWKVIQNHLQPFLDYFKWAVVSRSLWESEKAKRPETLTDIQRAVRYYYLQRLAFGGRTDKRTFGTSATGPAGLDLTSISERLLEVHWRLARVWIENLDAIDCITRYDRPETFFYIDPPYYFNGRDYAAHFEGSDWQRLLGALQALKGRFILSLNDCQEVRDLFAGFTQERVTLTYSCGNGRTGGAARAATRSELLIHNVGKRVCKPVSIARKAA